MRALKLELRAGVTAPCRTVTIYSVILLGTSCFYSTATLLSHCTAINTPGTSKGVGVCQLTRDSDSRYADLCETLRFPRLNPSYVALPMLRPTYTRAPSDSSLCLWPAKSCGRPSSTTRESACRGVTQKVCVEHALSFTSRFWETVVGRMTDSPSIHIPPRLLHTVSRPYKHCM